MKDSWVWFRNICAAAIYRYLLKPHFFRHDPEDVHDTILRLGQRLGSNPVTRGITRLAFGYGDRSLETNVAGIHFANPVGLAAGFDKNGTLTRFLPCVGFGYEEIGSITAEPCDGNPKPRLWRLPKSQALVVYYGLANEGVRTVIERLTQQPTTFPIGVSVAKTNCEATVETQAGIDDYVAGYRLAQHAGVYYTINISCPNTFGGQPFTDPERLDHLLSALDNEPHTKPIFIKLSPDLSADELKALISTSELHRVDGYICSNLTKKRDNPNILDDQVPERGGISGGVVRDMAVAQINLVYTLTKGAKPIIGVGGIFSADDAYAKIRAGASLIQLITGMIYVGPQLISEINRGLVQLLKQDGFASISEAVGADSRKT